MNEQAIDELMAEFGDAKLGLATTDQLLVELEARFETGLDGITPNQLCLNAARKIREWLTTEERHYKTVQDEEIDPYVIQEPEPGEVFVYVFHGERAVITSHEPSEIELSAIEEGALSVLRLEDDGTLSQISENGTVSPVPLAAAESYQVTHFMVFDGKPVSFEEFLDGLDS